MKVALKELDVVTNGWRADIALSAEQYRAVIAVLFVRAMFWLAVMLFIGGFFYLVNSLLISKGIFLRPLWFFVPIAVTVYPFFKFLLNGLYSLKAMVWRIHDFDWKAKWAILLYFLACFIAGVIGAFAGPFTGLVLAVAITAPPICLYFIDPKERGGRFELVTGGELDSTKLWTRLGYVLAVWYSAMNLLSNLQTF